MVMRGEEREEGLAISDLFLLVLPAARAFKNKFNNTHTPQSLQGTLGRNMASAHLIGTVHYRCRLHCVRCDIDRCAKAAFSIEKVLEIMHNDTGSHFDPTVIEALDRCLPRLLDIKARFTEDEDETL